jgi:RimJ/RimL family protein N-acetyltransferase
MVFWEVWHKGEKVGYLSLTVKTAMELYEVGNLMIDPRFKGKGVMTAAVRALTYSDYGEEYYSEVRASNMASRKLFLRCGFKEYAFMSTNCGPMHYFRKGDEHGKKKTAAVE